MKKESTIRNKITALCLLIIALLVAIIGRSGVMLIIACCVSIPLFFANRNYIISN